ncbi:MAG: GNAT family N-acetyltransferase [Deltaproteobacteria bacterium]|nr:GNAT family N-acetyltransferase [Deltaproteobacteria bacterium]
MASNDYPKEIILKNGSGVTLRPLAPGDEKLLFAFFNGLSDDDRWFLDADVRDPRVIEDWVRTGENEKGVSVVAILEGKIIGIANLHRPHSGSKRHIGEVEISVAPGFRKKHLATWMLLDLMNFAMSMGLEILVMYMVEGRDSSLMGSLKRLGFSPEAVFRDYLRDKEGNPYSLVVMVKRLQLGLDSDRFQDVNASG